jgi:hypothetical protein
MANNKDIKYINKDFSEYRAALINYAKTYFATTYNDFSPSSPGMMFMEQASYVGDVLSFYQDNQFQETFLQFARQTNNLYELAYMFGYKPNVTSVASTTIDFYQIVPSKNSGGSYVPDFDYTLYITENSLVQTSDINKVSFLVGDAIDFSYSSSTDPTEVTIYEIDGSGNPTYFLLKKSKPSISATINTTSYSFTTPQRFSTVNLSADRLVGILDATDSDGNEWYEVDYLAQDTIYDSIKNTNVNDPNFYNNGNETPFLLKLKQIQRRFATRFTNSGSLQIQFGAGNTSDSDEEIIPNSDNVGLGLPFEKTKLTTAYSPNNFVFTKTYGIAPSNTTITFRYLTGGGATANVSANTLVNFVGNVTFMKSNLDSILAQQIFDSLAVTNPSAADGGGDGDTIEEIRQNTISNFASQLRNVTQDDYLVRTLSLPARYGVISKAYIEPTKVAPSFSGETNAILDLYVLSQNQLKNLAIATPALKQNLITYLSKYRMINDVVNIKDAYIVNIGVNFEIIVLPDYNNNEVIANCLSALKDFFAIDKWQINQPIVLRDIYILLDRILGVQTVKSVSIENKVGENIGYSKYAYDISGATVNNVVYPSLDPCVFEVKYPDTDILGRVVSF